jgi:hypothetical protein
MGSIFGVHRLQPHPQACGTGITSVTAQILEFSQDGFVVEFNAHATTGIILPHETPSIRTDGLWQTTCFEAFFCSSDGSYAEFNLSPSFAWAAYAFDGYRHGMRDLVVMFDPEISISGDQYRFSLCAELPFISCYHDGLAISAVIEEIDGTKSYWALKHPPGAPDFHHKDCFALKLGPPERS